MLSLDIDITFFIQMGNFFIALIVLNYFIIKPIRTVVKQRREVVGGFIEETGKFSRQAELRLNNYQADLAVARAEATKQREAIAQVGLEKELELLEHAQEEAVGILQKNKKELEKDLDSSITVLRAQIDGFANKIVDRMME